MTTVTTYTNARATLAALCDQVASTREPVIIRRRDAEDVALVSAAELESLIETAHLLRSPKNTERLLAALARARSRALPPSSIEELRNELGLGQATPWTWCRLFCEGRLLGLASLSRLNTCPTAPGRDA